MRGLSTFVVIGMLSGILGPAPSSAATAPLALQVLQSLVVLEESRQGYERNAFRHWIDADGDGCNTRAEVLLAEAKQSPKVGSRCSLVGGRWLSAYDGKKLTKSSALDVDHLVPLAEAWDSGASGWTSQQREAYANDLGDPRSLVAVSAASNRSKSDKDPAQWLPAVGRCPYVEHWIAVKARWQLAVDPQERVAIANVLQRCPARSLTVISVPTIPQPTATATTTTPPAAPTQSPPTPADVYYANCSEARAAGVSPLHRNDPGYRSALDRDGDGIACE